MTTDLEVAVYDALMEAGLLEPIKERMQWEIEGEKQTTKVLHKIEDKDSWSKLTGFEKSLYKREVGEGHLNYSSKDVGEEMVNIWNLKQTKK